METVSNPLLRVGDMSKIAEIARRANAALVVDNTFATPVLVRPLELGANIVVHSATKYMAGHGDVMGGIIIADKENFDPIRTMSRTMGPVMSPFESYLTMRGIKTMPLRVERQCQNACKVSSWLATHPQVDRVYFTGDPAHPDAATIARMFPKNLTGAMLAFELKGAAKPEIFRFMEALKMIVRATSLGDVHSMVLYPAMASHRDISPKQRERMGIRDNLLRVSVGIEAVEDIIADLEQAFA
jgi:cystathionine gamma-synthase/methionine-gamma-lyase